MLRLKRGSEGAVLGRIGIGHLGTYLGVQQREKFQSLSFLGGGVVKQEL
jgi:hypothetical protein